MMKNIVSLFVCLVLANPASATEIFPFDEIINPGYSFHVDGNELLLVNDYSILVYDLNPVRLKFTIGRKGDGPSDFKYRPLLYVYPDFIIALDYTKTLWFSRKGELLKTKNYSDFADFNTNQEMRLLPVRNHYVRVVVDHDLCTQTVYLLDDHFKQIALLHEGLFDWWPPSPRDPSDVENFKLIRHSMDVEISRDKIFVSDSHRGFFIKSFNHEGQLLKIINYNSERCKRITSEYKAKAMNSRLASDPHGYYKMIPQGSFVFYTFYPPIESLRIDEDLLFATTYIKKNRGHEIVVMDFTGQMLKRIYPHLPSFKYTKSLLTKDLYAFDQGKLYHLVENKTNKKWELHIDPVDY